MFDFLSDSFVLLYIILPLFTSCVSICILIALIKTKKRKIAAILLSILTIVGIDGEKIIVGGESAGGGLAAALAVYARNTGKNCFAFQIPLYPMLDDRVTKTSANNHSPVWGTAENKAAWRIYLGDRVMNQSVPVYAAPARETDFSHLPPVISAIGTADPFFAEDLSFFNRIRSAGTPVRLFVGKGAYHAFDMMAPYAGVSKNAVGFLLASCKEYIEKYIQ